MSDYPFAPPPLPTKRQELLARLAANPRYDLAVVGGGATGLGVALDAAARGLKVVLIEAQDFAKGTSSRSTKLVHGGVRYLAQGNISLVREALRERSTLLHNAPHIAQPLAFVMPCYRWWEIPFYGLGLNVYDQLAGKAGLGKTQLLGSAQTQQMLPTVRAQGLRGGVKYWDGQFDDARLALAIARTAVQHGALLINYCRAERLRYDGGQISGLECSDTLTQTNYSLQTRCVINATGVWVDALREIDDATDPPGHRAPFKPMVAPSQGVHLVVDKAFLSADVALMVPKTSDGRVLFAVPWLGKVILGTTDTPSKDLALEPSPLKQEVDFILGESARYLRKAPTRANVKSAWVGLRPLVKHYNDEEATQKLSREHTVTVSRNGLVTVTGGKWTTYRVMAEDVLSACVERGLVLGKAESRTSHLALVGAPQAEPYFAHSSLCAEQGMHSYGTESAFLTTLPGAKRWLAPGLSEAMVRFAARYEYATCVEDVLARRCRLLFLDARLAAEVAPNVASVLEDELPNSPNLAEFLLLSQHFLRGA
ncbi:MAG: glycerol-3-phosphate dehydrogenase/oxidase [Rhodoferax sp.]|nr:glycerol-3-phosphate dehydrogenase/oxidase [Rhodoferax sp.]